MDMTAPGGQNMEVNPFSGHLRKYKIWRDNLALAISEYQAWVERQGFSEGDEDLRVYELIENLKSDKLTIALVAEFSRGKTELLNAIFFADSKQRLLPSSPGRTTMCPTELGYDEKEAPCIKLLPIESRKTALTIAEYKRTPVHWDTTHILKPNSYEEVSEVFQELTRTKRVTVRESQELGLYNSFAQADIGADGMVEIPMWRHAIINYPHPLLKQGLVILDTPGLNALGTEPELTLNMLPMAHAVLFLLAADVGVTKTDMEVWDNHVRKSRTTRNDTHLVVLNKIDALWDELHDDDVVARSLLRQVQETAHSLGVDQKSIFPVSAQKGLLGKIKEQPELVQKSGLPLLEMKLAHDIVPYKHEIIRRKILGEIMGRVDSNRALLESRLSTINKQLLELKKLGGKNHETIQKMVADMRNEKKQYDKELEGFQITRKALSEQAKALLNQLSIKSFDQLIKISRHEMQESWTTIGLKSAMSEFFDGITERMQAAAKQSNGIKKVVESIYMRLHKEYGMAKIKPAEFQIAVYLEKLQELQVSAEVFRNSPVTVMTEQQFVIKKFFITLVSEARNNFNDCNAAAKNWFQAIVTPVFAQIKEHKALIDRNLEALKKVHENMDSLNEGIMQMQSAKEDIETQLRTLRMVTEKINRPLI